MMKQRIMLLVGLTAVSLLILFTSCTQPTTPEPTTTPTIAPAAQPTSAPTLTPTLEPTPTPTYSQQANQLLLANGRFTTLLDELTQEIGRGISEAEQEQVMALARALWLPPPEAGLPDHLDDNDWLPDPAGVTLHWRPTLDGREGPVLLVEEAQPDSSYAAGALIFWQAERLLSLTPGGVGYYFEFGRVQQHGWGFDTWIEYDAEGNVASFVHPDTGKYVTPQGDGSVFLLSDLGSDGLPTNSQLYFENGTGELIPINGSPNPDTSLTDYMEQPGVTLGNALALYDNKIQSAPAFYQDGELTYVYNPGNQGWDQIISAAESEPHTAPPLHPEYTYNAGSMREYLHTYNRTLESGEQISLQIPIRIAVYDRWYVQSIDFKEPVLELMTESWLRSTHYMLGQMGVESSYDEYLQLLAQGSSPQIEGVSIENGEVFTRVFDPLRGVSVIVSVSDRDEKLLPIKMNPTNHAHRGSMDVIINDQAVTFVTDFQKGIIEGALNNPNSRSSDSYKLTGTFASTIYGVTSVYPTLNPNDNLLTDNPPMRNGLEYVDEHLSIVLNEILSSMGISFEQLLTEDPYFQEFATIVRK